MNGLVERIPLAPAGYLRRNSLEAHSWISEGVSARSLNCRAKAYREHLFYVNECNNHALADVHQWYAERESAQLRGANELRAYIGGPLRLAWLRSTSLGPFAYGWLAESLNPT